MRRAAAFLGLLLVFMGFQHSHGAATMHPIVLHGPSSNRLNIVVFSEGYIASQFSLFTNQAQTIVTKLLNTPPYSHYTNYFNAYAIFVASNETGSDHPPNTFRDTYFNSTYNSHSIERLITIPPNNWNSDYSEGRGKLDALLQEFMPEYDIVLLLVNDPQYGGSGGAFAVASVHASSAEIAIHEIGHFAGLGDEYENPAPGYPEIEDPNTTKETQRELIKWRKWIEESTPIPTPESRLPSGEPNPLWRPEYAPLVGLFEGAHYHTTGWYRPKDDCKMRTLGRSFCEVCRETLILYQYRQISMVDAHWPAVTNLTVWPGATITFSATTVVPSDHSLEFSWWLNGSVVPNETGSVFQISGDALAPGIHQVAFEARDPTLMIRNDPAERAKKRIGWRVTSLAEAPEIITPPPEVTPDGLRMEFVTNVPADFVLETSVNLTSWLPVLTNRGITRLSITNQIDLEELQRYFRVELRPQH